MGSTMAKDGFTKGTVDNLNLASSGPLPPSETNPNVDREELDVRPGDEDVVKAAFEKQRGSTGLEVKSGSAVEAELGGRIVECVAAGQLRVVYTQTADQVGP